MNQSENSQEENQTLSLWEVFQGVFAMLIGVQSEAKRERQFKYGKIHQFIIVGVIMTLFLLFNIFLLVKFILSLAGV